MSFHGSFTALVTPFKDEALDLKAFQDFVAWQIDEGSHGVVPCGTTGELPTLSHDEHRLVVEACIEVAKGRVPVMAGTGSNSTEEAIALTRHAASAGADAALIVCPYYNRPTQEGLYLHYRAIHDATDLPIFIYNVPSRSSVDMSVDTMRRLAELPRIYGVKDATADLARPLRTRIATGPDFIQFSGEDITAVPFLAQGGHGCISVTSNVAPRLAAAMQEAWRAGDLAAIDVLNTRLAPLSDALFIETNPVPVKWALHRMGRMAPDVRSPLAPLSPAAQIRVQRALEDAGVLEK